MSDMDVAKAWDGIAQLLDIALQRGLFRSRAEVTKALMDATAVEAYLRGKLDLTPPKAELTKVE
jgi:hypothetical protein